MNNQFFHKFISYTVIFLSIIGIYYATNPDSELNQPTYRQTTKESVRTSNRTSGQVSSQTPAKSSSVKLPADVKPSQNKTPNIQANTSSNSTRYSNPVWTNKNITIAINTTDPIAKQDFTDAINNWNNAHVIHLQMVNPDQHPNINCNIKDLSNQTKQVSQTETEQQLGVTNISYVEHTNQLAHADSYIDINSIRNMSHDQQVWVAEHELGHALGLQHTPEGSHTVMEPYNLTTGITPTDVNNLKNLYQNIK